MPTVSNAAATAGEHISINSNNNSNSNHHGDNHHQLVAAKRRTSGASETSSSQSSGTGSSGVANEERLMSSNADYDLIRNKTLMFFLDRLFIASKDGKEARTLHDLSCLFGTKDFTKEMRQIVGASRNGLKKFLQSYPSLFTIDGDKVYLTQLQQDSQTSQRDYNKEAVEYFRHKLLQFGASLVPIKNLFGYRSQASQEVRHISGKSSKEFKQFLRANPDVFELLADEHVMLKSALKELELRGESHSSLQLSLQPNNDENAVMDPYLNKQFAHSIEECMKRMALEDEKAANGNSNNNININNPPSTSSSPSSNVEQTSTPKIVHKVSVEFLHEQIKQDCKNQLFLNMVKTIDDLKVFLRMHPKIFKRFKCDEDQQREYVSLLSEEERKEFESSTTIMTRQQSSLRRCDTNESDISNNSIASNNHQPISLPTLHTSPSGTSKSASQQVLSQKTGSLNQRVDSSELAERQQATSLRATAPPFVPSSQKQQQPTGNPMQKRSLSNLNPRSANNNNGNSNARVAAIDPRQALRSHVIKASAANMANSLYSPSKQSNGAQATATITTADVSGDDLRARTVNIVREASNIITRILTSADAVAFDCKGYNLGFDGQITLIQFGFLPTGRQNSTTTAVNNSNNNNNVEYDEQPQQKQKPEVCIFDLITNPELAYCLKPLLESDQVVKIVHDVRNKSNALYLQFGIMLNHVFDTQVANLVIQQQETGKPAYKSRYISMSKLCEIYGDETLSKYRDLIKSKTRHHSSSTANASNTMTTTSTMSSSNNGKLKDVNYWKLRPLTDAMVYESTMDVYCLIGGVYQNLKSKIKPEYKPLFEQLNLEGVLARIKPEEIRSVKKERKIDLEVIDLKRKLYSDTTGSSIVLSNREIRLLRHIDLTEEVRQKIQQCKKVAKKLERLDMKAALNSAEGQQQASLSTEKSIEHGDNNQSLDHTVDGSLQTNGSSLHSLSAEQQGNASKSQEDESQHDYDHDDHDNVEGKLGETGMSDLMDSSMFDELKDKMIESSSLLESLEDDDDEVAVVGSGSHQEMHTDNCRCQCHRSSIEGDKGSLSLKSSSSSVSATSLASSTANSNSKDKTTSLESRVVDMAVQCDLLS